MASHRNPRFNARVIMTSKFNPILPSVELEFKDPAHVIDSFAIAAYRRNLSHLVLIFNHKFRKRVSLQRLAWRHGNVD
jgi:hypothetical protein